MLPIVITCFILLAILDRSLRLGRLEIVRFQTRQKLTRLADSLHEAASSGTVDKDAKLYRFCRALIDSVSANLEDLHLYAVLGVSLSAKDQASHSYSSLAAELKRTENSRYQSIVTGVYKCLIDFHREQHRIVFPLTLWINRWTSRKFENSDFDKPFETELDSREVRGLLNNPKIRKHDSIHQYC